MGYKDIKVSFLVTYYNQKEYVKQSIESILAIEKPCDWEILVGDDGSTDGTIEEIQEYVKQYPEKVKLYVMPRENGKKYNAVKRASANRLNLLNHSSGDFFCTLDGDDYYCDVEFIKESIKIFKKNENVSIISYGYKFVTDGIFGEEQILPTADSYISKKNFLKSYYIHAGGCVHRRIFDGERMKYISEIGYFDDNNIVINSLNYGDMYVANRAIYAYRQTGQSIFTSMNEVDKAVLNVQGMDVDLRLINDNLKECIIQRYAESFILMYICKNKLRKVIGKEKCNKYKEGCKSLKPSYCLDLLNYRVLPKRRKVELKILYRELAITRKKYTIKQNIKYKLLGVK